MKSYPIVPGIIQLKSNVEYIPTFQLGEVLEPKLERDNCLVKVKFKVSDRIDVLTQNLTHIAGSLYKLNGENAVYRVHQLIRFKCLDKIKLQILLRNLETNPELIVNKLYYRFLRFPIHDWLTPGHHLMNVIHAKLLLNGMGFAHCASIFDDTHGGIMLFGSPNVGKTLTAFLSVIEHGFKMISEDITLIDRKGYIYSCPYTLTYFRNKLVINELFKRRYLSNKDIIKTNVLNFMERISIISSFAPRPPRVSKIITALPFKDRAPVKSIIFLARTKSTIKEIKTLDEGEAMKLASFFNRVEFDYYRDPLILAYSLYSPEYHPDKLLNLSEILLKSLIRKVEQILLIKASSPVEYAKLIKDLIS